MKIDDDSFYGMRSQCTSMFFHDVLHIKWNIVMYAVNIQIDFGVLMVPMSLSFCRNFDRFYVVIINECQINLFDFLPVTNEFYDIY